MHHMHHDHDPMLMALSLLLAVLASHVGLDLVRRERLAEGPAKAAWIAAGATTMGMGIWSMHFVAMLAYRFPVTPTYDVATTVLSAVLAIVGSAVCFLVVSRSRDMRSMLLGGAIMGMAIVAMHYVGMAALILPGTVQHDLTHALAAMIIACGASMAALTAAFGSWRRIPLTLAALAMGIAVAGMHYTAMFGYVVHAHGDLMPPNSGMDPRGMALLIAGANFIILFMGLTSAQFDRRMVERVHVENEDIRRQKEFVDGLLEANNDPIVALDENMVVTAWNEAMAGFTGISKQDAIGAPLQGTVAWSQAVADLARETMTKGAARVETEYMSRHCVLSAFPIHRPQRRPGTLLVIRDESDLDAMRQTIRHAQRMDALGQMTGSVAHDFNNLLMVIGGNAQALRKSHPDATGVETILMAVDRGNGLMRKLLAFARRQNLRAEPIDLHERIGSALPLIRSAAGASLPVETKVEIGLPLVMADPNELEIALINLVVNAKDASPPGSSIVIAARSPEQGIVELSVSDSGHGMDEETIAKAFDPFFTTKEQGKGSGLGLSQVYGFAGQSNGRVRIDSKVGRGTTVTIDLMAANAPMRSEAPDSDIAVVLDRHPEVGQVLRDQLEQVGLRCEVAGNATAMLDAVSRHRGNVVLTVVDADSADEPNCLIAAMRARCPEIPTVLISNHRTSGAPKGTLLLKKPYSMAALEEVVQRGRVDQGLGVEEAKA